MLDQHTSDRPLIIKSRQHEIECELVVYYTRSGVLYYLVKSGKEIARVIPTDDFKLLYKEED